MRLVLLLFGFLSGNWIYAQSNYAVSLDGANDYVSLPGSVAVSQLNTFTVEAWVKWNGTGNGCIYSETQVGDNAPMFSIIPRAEDGGGIELTFRDNAYTGLLLQPAVGVVASNKWVHVAVVRTSATTMRVYVNGQLTDDASFTAPAAWTPTAVNSGVRTRVASTDFFGGQIDDLRIWTVARTQAQIKEGMFAKNLPDNSTGLQARYRFNEGSGTTAASSSTNTSGITGTLQNGPTWVSSPVQYGKNALQCGLITNLLTAPVLTTATTNVTMEAWVYHNGDKNTDHLLMSNGGVNTSGYSFFINTGRVMVLLLGGKGVYNTGVSVPTNQWCHFALVISTTGCTLYRNGVQVYTNSIIPTTPAGSFVIGGNPGQGQPYDGMVDEVRIWNVARTQAEIQAGMAAEIDPATPGLVSYYTFNQGIADGNNSGLTTVIDMAGNKNATLSNFVMTGSASNFRQQSSGLITLPVNWLSFTARAQSQDVLLQWSTAQEQDSKEFVAEHSADGVNWTDLGSVDGAGNSNTVKNYTYRHTTPLSGRNYYRIRQTDFNNVSTYSAVRTVIMTASIKPVKILSNPVVNNVLQLQVNTSTIQQLSLYTADGRLLWSRQLAGGTHSIDVSALHSGVYMLKTGTQSERLLVR